MKSLPEYITKELKEDGIININEEELCKYGMEGFLLTSIEILSVLAISFVLGNFIDTIIFFAVFIPLRIYIGGYHARSKLRCYTMLMIVFIIFTVVLQYVEPTNFINTFIICFDLIAIVLIEKYAPVINCAKTVSIKERQTYQKISLYIITIQTIVLIMCLIIKPKSKCVISISYAQIIAVGAMILEIIKNYKRR